MIETKFKNSEVGMIPEDWEVKRIEDIFDIIPNNTLSRECLNYSKGEYLNVHYGDVLIKFIEYVDCEKDVLPFINSNCKFNKFLLRNGDVIMADTAEDDTAGKVTEITNSDKKKIVSGLHTIPLRPKKEFASKFLGYAMNANSYHSQLFALQSGTKVTSVSKASIVKTKLAYPISKTEQSRIATVLSDIDDLIATTKKLIEKKRNIKEGAIQELLSGKRRLPGFKEKWVDVDFCNILYTQNSKSKQIEQKEYEVYGEYPIVDQGKTMIVGYTHRNDPIRKENGPYIIFGDHTCYFKFVDFDFFLGADGTQLLKCYTGYDTKFINYLCQRLVLPNTGYDRHFKYLKEVVFTIPRSVVEQQAIATILSEMDDEISMLESRLTKYQSMKQGMMQQLLTGKIRLI